MNIIEQKISALKTGIKKIEPTDLFVVSYPKSGNTWLRFIIANLISDELITMKNLNDFVPGIHNFKDKINEMPHPRFIKSHFPYFKNYPKTIYIYRDYRDVLVSYYHFQVSQNHFEGSINDFIKSNALNNFGSWSKHIKLALDFKKNNPDKILLLSYENLLKTPDSEIEKIIAFCNIIPQKSVTKVIDLCSFNSLQKNEKEHGKVFNNPNLTFFRKGTSEQWKEELSPESIAKIVTENKNIFDQLGYEI